MDIITHYASDKDCHIVTYDLNSEHKWAVLLHLAHGEFVVEVDGIRSVVPVEWLPHIRNIRWLNESEVAVWPISYPHERSFYVGRLCKSGSAVLDIGYPLDIFTDKTSLACIFPEEQIIAGADLDSQSDLISVYCGYGLRKMARFVEPFVEYYSKVWFMEVEHAVLDHVCRRFWFTAYDTPYLWCFAYDKSKVYTCSLECDRDRVIGISCREDKIVLVCYQNGRIFLQFYCMFLEKISYCREAEFNFPDNLCESIYKSFHSGLADARGYSDGTVAFKISDGVFLLTIDSAV